MSSSVRDGPVRDIRTGRFERTLSALTAAGAAVTAGEIYTLARRRQLRQQDDVVADRGGAHRHPGRSRAGFFSRRAAKTVLPVASAAIVINGLQGFYLALCAGSGSDPGGFTKYNMEIRVRPRSRRCWRRWSAGWACWPRCCAVRSCRGSVTGRVADAVPHESTARDHPAGPAAGSRGSTCWTRRTGGTT